MKVTKCQFDFTHDAPFNQVLMAAGLIMVFFVNVNGFGQEQLKFVGFEDRLLSREAKEGLAEIFSGRCFHVGIPLNAKKALDNPTQEKSIQKTGTVKNNWFVDTDQLPSPPSRESELPLGASMKMRGKVALVNNNCFQCHAGIVDGKVVAGLGNNRHIPFAPRQKTTDSPTLEQLQTLVKTEAEKSELAEFVSATRFNLNIPHSASRGDNFGPYVVWSLGAHLQDPKKQGLKTSALQTELVSLIETIKLPNVDPMPWWLMKYKSKDYWYGDGGIFDAAHFSFNFTTPHASVNEDRARHVEATRKALAFARETISPEFPDKLDAELVQIGADLFHGRTKPKTRKGFQTCANCHGSYSKLSSQLDLSKPGSWAVKYDRSHVLRNVKTDSTYNSTLQKLSPIADRVNELSEYYAAEGTPNLAPRFSVPKRAGYVAPPLVGVWASAPYFHNGSVPTVEAVLDSSKRPEIWRRATDSPHAYDREHVGFKFSSLTREELPKSNRDSFIYDTKAFGHGNAGHTFGDGLTSNERNAIIEFLKSLSGPNMPVDRQLVQQ